MKTMNNFQISGFVVNNATIIHRPLRLIGQTHGEDR